MENGIKKKAGTRFFNCLVGCFLIAIAGTASAQRSVLDPTGPASRLDHRSAIQRIVTKLLDEFPHVKGLVASVRGSQVYLTLESNSGVRPGTKMDVFRKMGAFKHPVTGEVLGHFEDDLGTAVVTDVRDRFVVAKFSPKDKLVPRSGDGVRISAALIRVALLPVVNRTEEPFDQDGVLLDFQSFLEQTGRFEVFDVDKLRVWLLEKRINAKSLLNQRNRSRLRELVRTDRVIVTEFRKIGERRVLKSRLSRLSDGKIGRAFTAIVNNKQESVASSNSKRRSGGLRLDEGPGRSLDRASKLNPNFRVRKGAPRRGIQRSQKLRWLASGLATGDFDGDKQQEIVLIHDSELNVYSWKKGILAEEYSYRASAGERFLTVDSIDLDRDGRPEVYVTNYQHPILNSFVLGFKNGKYTILKRGLDSFFRVIQGIDGKPILAGQALGLEAPFYGKVHEYEWKNGGPVVKGQLPLPRGLSVYGFNYWDVDDDGIAEIVEIKKFGRIAIYRKNGRIVDETREKYGGYLSRFRYDQALTRLEDRQNVLGGDVDPKYETIRGRLLLRDMTGDKRPDLVVPINLQRIERVQNFGLGDSEIAALTWDGSRLHEQWRSRKIGGIVVDYQFVDLDGDGQEELAVAVVEKKLLELKAGTTRLVVYRLKNS